MSKNCFFQIECCANKKFFETCLELISCKPVATFIYEISSLN